MPTLTIKEFKPIPAGTYLLRINNCKVAKSKADEEFYVWELEVVDNSDIEEKVFTWNSSITASKNSQTYRFLVAAGLEETEGSFDINTDDFIGQEFYSTVTIVKNRSGTDVNKIEGLKTIAEFERDLKKFTQKAGPVKSQSTAAKPQAGPAKPQAGLGPVKPGSGLKPSGKPLHQPVQQEEATEEGGELTDFPQ